MPRTGLLSKEDWKTIDGARKTPKRLHLAANTDGDFVCPVSYCDSQSFKSQRGCRKHVSVKHGWYYFFDERPDVDQTIFSRKRNSTHRSNTTSMPSFSKEINVYKELKDWLINPAGGSKSICQAEQVCMKVMKFLKFCCEDSLEDWNVPYSVVDYYLGSLSSISGFIDYLKDSWKVGIAGIIGYMNAISHLLDYRRLKMDTPNIAGYAACEIYLSRIKRSLSKQMKAEWTTVLSVDYLTKLNCWATLDELQEVIPFHADKFTQILLNTNVDGYNIPAHDQSFCTAFIITVLFLMVKAARPMSYQFLTVDMVRSVKDDGSIDQTVFKTKVKYGFDTLIFTKPVLHILNGYIKFIRTQLNPKCSYLLINRNGQQLTQISNHFGRLVYQAIGKHINPTRYRQIIETESSERLNMDDQNSISEDQKHTSIVAKIHYQKKTSQTTARKGNEAMSKLVDRSTATAYVNKISESIQLQTGTIVSNENSQVFIEKKAETEGEDDSIDMTITTKTPKTNAARNKKIPFSKQEDSFLKQGIEKYGSGKWKNILEDCNYKFHYSRKTATLYTRAKRCKFI